VTRRIEEPDKIIVSMAAKADFTTPLLLHEVHHRTQAMAILRQLGVEAHNLDYLAFAAKREEFRRTPHRVAKHHTFGGLRTDFPPIGYGLPWFPKWNTDNG
jgi:hypothetical protein